VKASSDVAANVARRDPFAGKNASMERNLVHIVYVVGINRAWK
jgi:hypothetical protein